MKQDTAAKMMITTAVVFMGFALTFGLFVALKYIYPNIGNIEYLSAPRMRMWHTTSILYGWLLPAGMGILLYIMPRILHTKLYSERLGVITGVLYFASIIGGLIGMLLGNIKNIEYGEIGSPYDYLLIVSWLLFGTNIIGTIVKRKVKYLYVSVWYALGAVIWTSFVMVTGHIFTQMVNGVNQANLNWFFVHNIVGLIFTPLGVSAAYYLIPKQLNTPIYSHKLSMIGFWVISFVYVWTGAHHMMAGPSPDWLETVASVFSFSLLIPVIAVITNFLGTFATAPKENRFAGPVPKFLMGGTIYYLLTCIQGPMQAIPSFNLIISKNDWVIGHAHMALFGGFSFFAIAGVYYIVPKIANRPLFNPKLADQTFWIMLIASVPFFTSLFVSGVIQGNMWMDPENTFVQTLMATKSWHTIRALSGAFIIYAYFLFVHNVIMTLLGKSSKNQEITEEVE
jgi:cytochrome c oxidase cbb3-type subunit 1